jgi:hypothetical protein
VYNEIARAPFNPYNTISLIGTMFPDDDVSQSQSQTPMTTSPDSQRRIEMTTLVNHISKSLAKMSQKEREYVPFLKLISTYDASQHPTLLKNQEKMAWSKVAGVLMTYLDSTKILFQRSEILISPERRVQGVKVDDKMIQKVAEKLQRESGFA